MTSTTPRTTSPRRRIATLEQRLATTATTTADAPARHLTEAQFQRQVTDLLTLYGWLWTHTSDSRTVQGHAGVPDILAVRDGRLAVIELKTARGRLRPGQRDWLARLATVRTVELYLWRPNDLERIVEVLR